jgi:NitT/TauT family transport system ATP-binding protein
VQAVGTSPLKISNLSKSFRLNDSTTLDVLQDVNLHVDEGEIVCIVGRSGCGKSTLLNLIAGILAPDRGEISVFGSDPVAARPFITYLQQNPLLLAYRTAFENACLGLELRHELNDQKLSEVRTTLGRLHLNDFLSYFPENLSGGMQQRIAFARTVSPRAPLILCDEPFASLDFETRLELEEFFWSSVKAQQRSSIFVTHDIESAIVVGDRVLVMSARPASIAKSITIDPQLRSIGPNKCREASGFTSQFAEIWQALREVEK